MLDATPASDHALMLAVRNGRLEAMGELFERHHGALFGFLFKLLGERTAAEDVVQTVFQRMLKYRHTYREEGHFAAWMYHMARRCAADQARKAARAPTAVDPAHLDAAEDFQPAAAELAAARDDRVLLQAALNRLEPADREVLLLSRLQELSFAEVADIMECSAGAARVRAHRAMQALRAHFFQLQQKVAS